MKTDDVMWCCHIDPNTQIHCHRPATWEAYGEPSQDPYSDYTHACDDHLGHLLEERPHRVAPIPHP